MEEELAALREEVALLRAELAEHRKAPARPKREPGYLLHKPTSWSWMDELWALD